MTTKILIEDLERLHGIMMAMLDEATNANWQELARLDSERRVLINFQDGHSPQISNAHRARNVNGSSIATDNDFETLRRRIINLDQQINDTVMSARAKIIDANRDFRQQAKAKQSYASTNAI